MAAFEDFMNKEYPYYKAAGGKNVDMWRDIWNAAIKHAEALKPSHNTGSLQLLFTKWNCIKKPNGEWQHAVCNFIRWVEEQQQASA